MHHVHLWEENPAAQARVWCAVPGKVDAQTFASLLSLIPTLSQISVWMYIIPLPMAIWRAQEQWIDTEYFCCHYSLSVKLTMQVLYISLTKNHVSNCPCWFCSTMSLWSAQENHCPAGRNGFSCRFFSAFFNRGRNSSPRRAWELGGEDCGTCPLVTVLWGSFSRIHWPTSSCKGIWGSLVCWWCSAYFLFLTRNVILQPRCRHEREQTGWSWPCCGQRQCWQLALNCSHYPSLKAVSTLRSLLASGRLLLTKSAEVMMSLVWFFSVKSWRHSGTLESPQP